MSSELPPEPGDDTLDRLLAMTADPPQLDPDARARLLARLQRSREVDLSPPAATPGRPRPPELPMSVPPPNRLRPVLGYTLAIAATGLLVWSAASFLLPDVTVPDAPDPKDSLAELGELSNDAARPRLVTLADGSTLILREGAAFAQLGPRRLQLLRGEALLEVMPGTQPFSVVTTAGEVEVRGTKFVLRQDDTGLLASVLRGELRLVNTAGEATLRSGESANLSPETAPVKRPAERLSHEVAWARDALGDASDTHEAVRRGNLLGRFPAWNSEWPLPVRSMDVDVHVEDGVARTTIDQTFFNHSDYQLEGVYSFPLPSDAAISRLAMYVDGKLMEAGITERQEGREIYESIVHRRRDPALLEWMQGNEFRMRIFPLPARTEKRILLSYTEPLESLYGDYSVRVPIPELDLPVGTLRYRIHVKDKTLSVDSCCVELTTRDEGEFRIAEATLYNVPIGEDLALTLYPTAPSPPVIATSMRDPNGDYLMVRARPDLPRTSQHTPRRWVVLHDTSASRSPQELAAQTRFLKHLLRELDEADRITLLAFDSTVRPLAGGFTRVDALDPATVDGFLAREGRDHVGGSALGLAVGQALELLAADGGSEAPHILYLGDGLLSEPGDAPRAALRDRLGTRATFIAAALGDETDLPLLDQLAAATGGLRVQLNAGADLRWQALDLAAALNTARVHGLRARLLGPGDAEIAAPLHLSSASVADGEAIVALSRGTRSVPEAILLEGTLAGAPWSQRMKLPKIKPDAGYLPRLWARAQIEADIRGGAEAHKAEITALGLEHFLVTPFTSLLVLENEAMYGQYKVRRPDVAGWAHYDAPAKIKVVTEPHGTLDLAPDQIIQRQPVRLVSDGQDLHGRSFSGGEEGEILGLGGLGLIGTGRGGGGTGDIGIGIVATGRGAGFGGRGTGVPAVRMGAASFGPAVPAASAAPDDRFVSGRELAKRRTGWQRDDHDLSAASPTPMPAPDTATASHFTPDFMRAESRGHASRVGGGGQPLALHYLGDARLGDLGEHVPALFEDGFDRERELLLGATAAAGSGKISDEARALLTRARASLTETRYAVDGGVLAIEAGGHFTRSRRIGGYLREVVRYDGDTLVATYPELDLAVERRVGLAEPALLSQWVPWVLPSPDALARWYSVELLDANTVRMQATEGDDRIDLRLDDRLRLVAITRRSGETVVGETRFEHDDHGLTIVVGDERRRVEHSTDTPDLGGLEATTRLQLPLRSQSELDAALARTTPGSAAWRDLQRQRLAVLAALGQFYNQPAVVTAMRAHGPLTRGELVLAGAGVVNLAGRPGEQVLADLPGDPVAAYLGALRRLRKNATGPMEQVAKASPGTLLGLLASHTRLLADAPKGVTPTSLARLREFFARYDHPELAYIATHQIAGSMDWRRPGTTAPAWQALATAYPTWAPIALHSAGTAYQYASKTVQANELYAEALAAAVDGDQIPIIDWNIRNALQRSSGGHAAWRMQWNRWRAAIQKSGDVDQMIAFMTGAELLGEAGEGHRMISGADLGKIDPDRGPALILALTRAGLVADAQQVLRPLLAAAPEHPPLLALAAIHAEQQGDLGTAADLGERSLAARGDLPLVQLRAAYRTLLELRARLASTHDLAGRPRTDQTRDPLDRALDVAARWRAEDPDNPEIDERCATLLFTLGHHAEARRHLDSIVERHPADGSAHARVARLLEREGLIPEADLAWQSAIAVEPTDPTWLVGRAENRLATGDRDTARALALQVTAGKWQDRFWQQVQEATALRDQLVATRP